MGGARKDGCCESTDRRRYPFHQSSSHLLQQGGGEREGTLEVVASREQLGVGIRSAAKRLANRFEVGSLNNLMFARVFCDQLLEPSVTLRIGESRPGRVTGYEQRYESIKFVPGIHERFPLSLRVPSCEKVSGEHLAGLQVPGGLRSGGGVNAKAAGRGTRMGTLPKIQYIRCRWNI